MADPSIRYRIGVDDAATASLRRIDSSINGVLGSFKSLAAFGGLAAVSGTLLSLGRSAFAMADELQNASERLGVSASVLQRVKIAAEQSGASLDSVQRAMVFLARQTDAAVMGNEGVAKSFKRIGLEAKSLSGIPLDRRIATVAQQLALIDDPGKRAALAFELLGKSAIETLPFLVDLDNQLDQINTTLSDEQIRALDDAKDTWDRWGNYATTWTAKVLTGLEDVAKWWAKFNSGEVGPFAKKGGVGRPGGGISQRTQRDDVKKAFSQQFEEDAKGADKSAQKAADKIAAEIQRIVDSTRTPFEEYQIRLSRITELHDKWGLSAEDAARAMQLAGEELGKNTQAAVDASIAGQQWNKDLEDTKRIIEGLQTPFDNLAAQYQRIDDLVSKGLLTPEQAGKAKSGAVDSFLGPVAQHAEEMGSRVDAVLKDIADNTAGLARDITDVFFDTTQSVGDMFENLLDRVARAIVEKSVIQPLIDFATSGLSSLFGGGLQPIQVPNIPKRAMGGPAFAGTPYLVGERGPELFVPRTSGSVQPSGSFGSAPSINVTVVSTDPNRSGADVVAALRRAYARAGKKSPI